MWWLILGVLKWIASLFGGKGTAERLGRAEEKLDQHERAQDAKDRMDDVDRGDKRSLLERLRGSGKL